MVDGWRSNGGCASGYDGSAAVPEPQPFAGRCETKRADWPDPGLGARVCGEGSRKLYC